MTAPPPETSTPQAAYEAAMSEFLAGIVAIQPALKLACDTFGPAMRAGMSRSAAKAAIRAVAAVNAAEGPLNRMLLILRTFMPETSTEAFCDELEAEGADDCQCDDCIAARAAAANAGAQAIAIAAANAPEAR